MFIPGAKATPVAVLPDHQSQAAFPGLIQESRGRLAMNCSAEGTWSAPKLRGTLRVDRAGAYLPSTGIQVNDVTMDAQFEDQTVRITSFGARSGPGRLEGAGTVWLEDRRIDRIDMNLSGERFQVVRLPEMEMLASPSLTFRGSPKNLQVRGDIKIPELPKLPPDLSPNVEAITNDLSKVSVRIKRIEDYLAAFSTALKHQ